MIKDVVYIRVLQSRSHAFVLQLNDIGVINYVFTRITFIYVYFGGENG